MIIVNDKDKLLAFGLNESEADTVLRLAKDKGLNATQLVRQALRLYQSTVEPVPDLGPGRCMSD